MQSSETEWKASACHLKSFWEFHPDKILKLEIEQNKCCLSANRKIGKLLLLDKNVGQIPDKP
jgi:hypothetical protein